LTPPRGAAFAITTRSLKKPSYTPTVTMKAAKIACRISVEANGTTEVPISTPTKIPSAQVRKNVKSKLPSATCLRVDASALGSTSAIDVPTATCISRGDGTPNSGNKYMKIGMRTMPPPMPNNPDEKPEAKPANANAPMRCTISSIAPSISQQILSLRSNIGHAASAVVAHRSAQYSRACIESLPKWPQPNLQRPLSKPSIRSSSR
jgi:hypothetical protein